MRLFPEVRRARWRTATAVNWRRWRSRRPRAARPMRLSNVPRAEIRAAWGPLLRLAYPALADHSAKGHSPAVRPGIAVLQYQRLYRPRKFIVGFNYAQCFR